MAMFPKCFTAKPLKNLLLQKGLLVTFILGVAATHCNEAPKRRTGGPGSEGTGKLTVSLKNPPQGLSSFKVVLSGDIDRTEQTSSSQVTFLGLAPGAYTVTAKAETYSASYLSDSGTCRNQTIQVTQGTNAPLSVEVCTAQEADVDKFNSNATQAEKEQQAAVKEQNAGQMGGDMGPSTDTTGTSTQTATGGATVIVKPKLIENK